MKCRGANIMVVFSEVLVEDMHGVGSVSDAPPTDTVVEDVSANCTFLFDENEEIRERLIRRSSDMKKFYLSNELAEQVDFLAVYAEKAHPNDGHNFTYKSGFEVMQAKVLEKRLASAKAMVGTSGRNVEVLCRG
ncbi:hypothetical protein CAPTEDRAFT_195608 [Capitella teleta]|uniref:Uncharacterized protein n=1 Tax=Capitella teleta TaxID=283909 RepID=R7TQ95_CAPTE|nr:hypothetical protein CAPTEDRAFT_195608 [Capitella teleta]|eukprot:ELT96083.1 hypothetical protein CAPTEDRAFT_195608 [Capitella teleta]